MALARRSLPGMPSAARFSSLWTAVRFSGFGASTLMCPIPVTHTHTHTPLAATLNKERDECRWVIPQARFRTPAGTLAGTLPHGTFVAASGRRTAARQTGMALARRSLPGMPSAARFSSLWTAGRVSGFGPSTLMCPIPCNTHTQTLALLRLPHPPCARSSRVPPSPLRPPPARLAALPATVPGWVGPLSGGGGVRVLDLPLPPTGMLAALGLAIRRPSTPSPPFAPDRSLSPPFAARAVLHAFIQSRGIGHGLCAPSPSMGIASVTSQITGPLAPCCRPQHSQQARPHGVSHTPSALPAPFHFFPAH